MPTNAELTAQLGEMTTRATTAETQVEKLTAKLTAADALVIAKTDECGELRTEVAGLTDELTSTRASLKAFKGSATKLRNELTIVRRDLSPEARPFGAPKPAKSEEQAAERAAALAAAFAADTTELVFSDGRREIRELAPLAITGDAWRDTPNGRVLNAEIDLEPGDCQRETMELRGFALLDEAGEQVGYCALPDAIVIGRNQHFRLPLNTVRF